MHMHPLLSHGRAVFMKVNIVLLALVCTFGFMSGNILQAYIAGRFTAQSGNLWLGIVLFSLSLALSFAMVFVMADEGAKRISANA